MSPLPNEVLVAIATAAGGIAAKTLDFIVSRLSGRASEVAQFQERLMTELENERKARRQDLADLRVRIDALEGEKLSWEQARIKYMDRELELLKQIAADQREILERDREIARLQHELKDRDARITKLESDVKELTYRLNHP